MHTQAARRGLRAVLLVVGLPLLVVALRLGLDTLVGPRGWYLAPFLAAFIAARVGGLREATAITFLIAAARLVVGPPGIEPADNPTLALDIGVDLLSGGLALTLAVALGEAGSRARTSDRAAERNADRLNAAARREHAARRLAAELANPLSIRQISDRFASRAQAMVDAIGVAVMPLTPISGDRAAGGPREGPLAIAGRDVGGAGVDQVIAEAVAGGRAIVARATDANGDDTAPAGPLLIAVPLLAGPGPIAGAVVALDGTRGLDDEELEGLVLLGRIAGEAIARSGLATVSRQEARRAREAAERISRLQHLAAALGRELDAVAIARHVVDAASDGTGSSMGVLNRVDPERGELEVLHARGYPVGLLDRERRTPLRAELPASETARTGRPIVVDAAGWKTRFPGASDLPAMAGLDELISLPVGGDHPIAVLVMGRAGSDRFDADDQGFLEAVAEHAAQALRRAALVDLLRDRDRRLGLTLGVARAGSWELDVESGRMEVSGELRRLYGTPEDMPLEGLDAYLALIHEEDRDDVRSAVTRTASGAGPFTVEFRVRRPEGGVLRMLGVGRTFHDRLGRPSRLMAIDRDVTPERQAESERERLLEQEREARRLNEAFFGVMSHELRTPVTTIIAGARLIGRTQRLDPIDREVVDDIAAEADRLHRLIEDLLVLSRLERGNLVLAREPVHVGHLVRRVVEHEARRWPETTFRTPRLPARDVIDGEETYVEQVLRNLLSNAAKYSPVGSVVEVEVERVGDEVAVRVLDQGAGVGSDELGDLFSLFYRSPATAAAASGAGIGLFVCERLIRAMGGRIWARRRSQVGSEFGFALRVIADEDALDDTEGVAAGARS